MESTHFRDFIASNNERYVTCNFHVADREVVEHVGCDML